MPHEGLRSFTYVYMASWSEPITDTGVQHFRLMRMGTIHANNPNEEFRKLVGELARFCTAASELPGLAESISGLCENVFDPLGYDYSIERHREAIVLAREDWPDLPRDGIGNMPLLRPAHEVADVTGSTVDACGTVKAAVDTAGSAGGTAENVVDTLGGAVSAVRTDIHPRMKPIVDSAVKITLMSLHGAGAANAHVNDVAAPDKTIRVVTRLFVDAAAYLAAEAVCDAGENDPLVDAIINDVIAKVICSVEAGTGIAYLDVEEVVNAHLTTISRPVTQDDPARLGKGVDIADADIADADMADAEITDVDTADADIADADADVEMVPPKVFLYVSDDCDVETTQALAKDMQSALVADKFPYRGNNRDMEANITMTEAEEIVNFVFYNINRLPLFIQRILQQIHGVPGDSIINAARYTTMDYTQYAVPTAVRLFASTWFESKFPEEQSVLRQVRRDVASVNLQATFEIFCDGLVGKHTAPRSSWQFWARRMAFCSGPDVVGCQGSIEGTAVPERANPWKRVAERALMAEIGISECEWASATLEWSFRTPFVNAFGVGIIPIFIGYAEYP